MSVEQTTGGSVTEIDREIAYRLARAYLGDPAFNSRLAELAESAIAGARAEERERCAQVADNTGAGPPYDPGAMRALIAQRIRECGG